MNRWTSVLLASVLAGCGGKADDRVENPTRQASRPYISADARLRPFLGTWEYEGEQVVSVVRQSDGAGKVLPALAEDCDVVVNRVRLDGESLFWDRYRYIHEGSRLWRESRGLAEHLSGIRVEVKLTPGAVEGELQMWQRVFGVEDEQPIKLTRKAS